MPSRHSVRQADDRSSVMKALGAGPAAGPGAPDLRVVSALEASPEVVYRAVARGLASGAMGGGLSLVAKSRDEIRVAAKVRRKNLDCHHAVE